MNTPREDRIGGWFLIPLVYTMMTLLAGLAGLLSWPSTEAKWLLGASLVTDMIDGPLARCLEARTRLGAWFAWSVDVCLGYGLAWKLPHPYAIVAVCWLLIVQSEARERDIRMSGRGLLFLTTILLVRTP